MTNKQTWIGIALVALVLLAGTWWFARGQVPVVQESEVVELKDGDTYDLSAGYVKKSINGTEYKMLAYNGSIPAPLIKVPQGAEVTINFKNNTDMKTLLHSHGVRMDNAFDGSQTSQKEMEPGEVFSYTLSFPDTGMFWYHPHVREDYQQELGLYGNYLVVPAERYWSTVNREVPLVLDDILIEDGTISLSKERADRVLMGRFGNVMLVNGDTDYTLSAQKGEVVRFYVTNVANTRVFNFAIPNARIKLVGADGGAYERDQWATSILIGPSERAVIEVLFDQSGTFAIEHQTPDKTYTLGKVVVAEDTPTVSYAEEFELLTTHAETIESIDPYRSYVNAPPDKKLALSVSMMGMMEMSNGHDMHSMSNGAMNNSGMMMGEAPEGGIEWEDDMGIMNAMSNPDSVQWHVVDQDTGQRDMAIDWSFPKGKPVKIRIVNDATSMHPMQHPIHFHGQRFLIVARDGVPESNLAWKDTVLVKAGETVDIVLDTSNPGTWMAHCHIAEHLEAGMMFTFKID